MPNTAPSRRAIASKSRNSAKAAAAIEMEGHVEFGKIVKNLGGRNMVVMNSQKKECIAHIPGVLAHRSSTPIVSESLVVIVPRSYESRSNGEIRYEIFAVVQDKKDIREAIKSGMVPEWMLNDSKIESSVEVIEFDYTEIANKDSEVNIDDI